MEILHLRKINFKQQGEIMRKGYVQEKFREKLTKTLHDDIINESQWIEMKKLLTAIFSVFED